MNRAEFEKWASTQYGDAVSLSHDGLLHAEPFVQTLFIGWQAAKEQYAEKNGLSLLEEKGAAADRP